ncbi:PREDICTED: endogenous retrovirus group K member 11 Pol protein-like [Thamnophis sirtalis]|uniref:Endogenous retrovirus group K member 11 Pol protein-like n=1 Tax=Thamnophis sirtalis TaxID=35019 RepID=A0A6I9Y8N5_9SAUR|nr:PREDICTED: endogenous retrovirus group K member 11 Pol protein-like [Thamnophis sirtalis]
MVLKDDTPIWQDQWPLPGEKLDALQNIVEDLLKNGKIEPSNSPYNTPVFVIKKKSGKWRMLQDLRKINAVIVPMGPLQCGLPNPNLIPQNYDLTIIDLKDAFFSIPLCKADRKLFAFTIPVYNHHKPVQRYQWTVLPQGMLNSPTMCQYYIGNILQHFREQYQEIIICHYMDDILLACKKGIEMRQVVTKLLRLFNLNGFQISEEKIQTTSPFAYLGHIIMENASQPVLPELTLPHTCTLVELQKYLGTLNWARPYMGLTTVQLQPLFDLLKGGKQPGDNIQIGENQKECLELISRALNQKWVDRCEEGVPISVAILGTPVLPTGILFQKEKDKLLILEWIHLPNTPKKTISTRDELLAQLIMKLRDRCIARTGREPENIFTPVPLPYWEQYFQMSEHLQMALANYNNAIKYHLPADYRIALIQQVPFRLNTLFSIKPLQNAITVFADGTKKQGACVYREKGKWVTHVTSPQASAQRAELAASILAFQLFFDKPFNLIVDSLYVYNAIVHIFDSYISPTGNLALLAQFIQLKQLIEKRTDFYFVAHIRSHQPFPGMLTEGNNKADEVARNIFHLATPWESHEFFHQNANALRKEFDLTRTEASAIIQQCPTCSKQGHNLPMGVNPRGLQRNEIWQMDITQHPPFAPWKYIHVTVDTCSGFIFATVQRGETNKHVINHCIRSFAVLGTPKELKTDNGPAYVSSNFAQFCKKFSVTHKFGIPYNSQGQGIVERANLTIKLMLEKQKEGGNGPPSLPSIQTQLAKTIYTINFKNLTGCPNPTSAAERHFSPGVVSSTPPLVLYRTPPDPTWKGPAELLTWGRGYAAVKGPDNKPLWVPARGIKPFHPPVIKSEQPKSDDI